MYATQRPKKPHYSLFALRFPHLRYLKSAILAGSKVFFIDRVPSLLAELQD
jgi:hypothetical protein